jgi:2-oxoisovalerate dehydrogenase E1 component
MRLSRDLDERFESLRMGGRLAKWYSAVGNEATTVPAGLALEPGDVLCTLHRDVGAILGLYLDPDRTFPGLDLPRRPERPDPVAILARLARQLLGKAGGFSEGIERSFHYGYLAPAEGILHLGMISHLGSMIPVAAGCAFALKQRGGTGVAVNFIGDGGTSTGDFHEGLNMAAVWKLPLVLIIENNRYAFSTPAAKQYAAERLSDRGPGYGVAAETIDGNDAEAMAEAVARAVERARRGDGPTLLEAMVGRMRGHAEGDDSLKVVPPEQLGSYLEADPVSAYRRRLEVRGALSRKVLEGIEMRITELVEAAVEAGLAAPEPRPESAERPALAPAIVSSVAAPTRRARGSDGPTSYVEAIHLALEQALEEDPDVVLMGQDIGAFEGAFRVTRGLYRRWPQRVLDTPIAESGTLGIAAGAALLGYRPVVEMQFADFVSCGFNQLVNVLAKLYYRFEVPCPVVVRLPSGGGVGAGPFHSQNPEGWFAHTAGLEVVVPATARDAYALLLASIRDPNPVVFCEHKFLYRRIKEELGSFTPEDFQLGKARVARHGRDLTLIGYGAQVFTCLEVAEALVSEGVEAEVIDLRTLVPFDEETVVGSVKKTGRVLVVHEAQRTAGFGAEVTARLAELAFPWLDAPPVRVAYPDRPVPYAKVLERHLLPDRHKVLAAARRVLEF